MYVGDPPLVTADLVAELAAAASSPGPYDPRLAYVLSVVSAWSYSDAETLSSKLRFYGFSDCTVQAFEVTNHALFVVATGYVVRQGGVAVVSFRGTDPVNLVSWLTDTNVALKDLPDSWCGQGRVHEGFLANFEAIWADIEGALRAPPAAQSIYVTGHSLGGAMAVLAAAKLQSAPTLRPKLRGVYTFGQPAVGDETFAEWARGAFGAILFRHVYGRDVVPRLPPRSAGAFCHFGSEYRSMGSVGTGHAPKESWRLARTPRALFTFLVPHAVAAALGFGLRRTFAARFARWLDSIDDHLPAPYLATSRNAAHLAAKATPRKNDAGARGTAGSRQASDRPLAALIRLREWRARA